MNLESIRKALQFPHGTPSPFQEFAVMIPLFQQPDGLHVLFEVRSEDLRSQPGEICLPGGRLEPDESPEHTALREACEELGIAPDTVTLLGNLAPQYTPFRYALHPFVCYLDPFSYPDDVRMNPAEVAETFTVPLAWLLTNEPLEYRVTTRFEFPPDLCVRIESPSGLGGGLVRGAVPLRVAGAVV